MKMMNSQINSASANAEINVHSEEKTMKTKKSTLGFTLAELLIVVAIIAVLVAIAIPIFSSQLEKSREATDLANIRGAYAEIMAKAVSDENGPYTASVELKQKSDDWQTDGADETLKKLAGETNVQGVPQKDGKATLTWQNDTLTIVFEGALPVTFSEDDFSQVPVYTEKYGKIVSYLMKNNDMKKMKYRYDECEGAEGQEKVKIFTIQTKDNETTKEIKDAMKDLGYSDSDIESIYKKQCYAYLDKDGNLIGYHGPGSGGMSQLYIVGYDKNPVSVGGAIFARQTLATYIQTGSVPEN